MLYSHIYDALASEGVFYNADIVLGSSDALQAIYMAEWRAFMQRSVSVEDIDRIWLPRYYAEDRPAELLNQLAWLTDTGFADVDVVWKYYNFAVYGGRRPLMTADVNLWRSPEHALDYLARADTIPHRTEGEAALLDSLPERMARVLDLGSGDGRLLALIKLARPHVCAVAVDFSDAMLARLQARFVGDEAVAVVSHDLDRTLPDFGGPFDTIVSSFAIHHLAHPRKRSLYAQIFDVLAPGGMFCNLEHVASATEALHHQFLAKLGITPDDEDPSNKLLDVETQLTWLCNVGFVDVDCHWKWRELALLVATKPA